MLEQLRRQGDLTSRLNPQPGIAAQLDEQSIGGRWCGEFHLHEGGRRFELGALVSPTAEGGVVESVLTGEGGGGQSAPIKGRQQSGALGGGGARGARGAIGTLHRPGLPRAIRVQQGVAKSPLTLRFNCRAMQWQAAS